MNSPSQVVSALRYDADLIGNITQVLAGLQGYETMALELLQNADDAGASSVRFDLRNDRLIVTHDSEFTSCGLQSTTCPWREDGKGRRCDFHGISLMASAGKARDAGQIGRFGIGFVSVYQVTDRPTLTSSGIALTLDPLTRENTIIRLATEAGTRIDLPWASSYSPTRRALQTSPVPTNISDAVLTALNSVCREGLLFLRNLEHVEIARSGNLVARFSIERSETEAIVMFPDGRDEWLILTSHADPEAVMETYEQLKDLQRSTEVKVAFPIKPSEPGSGKLYAYLPTGQASGLPCHIQADFFPRQDRRSIVTTGGSHERAFNLLLIAEAADLIADNLTVLRDALEADALWALLDSAYSARSADTPLGLYWPGIEAAAAAAEIALGTDGVWRPAKLSLLPPADLPDDEERAACRLGLSLITETLRPRRNLLQALGARPLSLAPVVDALTPPEGAANAGLDPLDIEALHGVWALLDRLLATDKTQESTPSRYRLQSVRLVPDRHGAPSTINEMYRPPSAMTAAEAAVYIPDTPIIHDAVREHAALWDLVDELTPAVVAQQLADARDYTDESTSLPNDTPDHLGRLMDWLASFEIEDPEEIRDILNDTPILPCGGEVLPPARALWPGGFTDPIGHLRLIDTAVFSAPGADFVKAVLGVEVLTFRRYLVEHLDTAIASEPTKEAYQALLQEILRLEHELQSDMSLLRKARLCRDSAGDFVRAGEAYKRTEQHEALLGSDYPGFLDSSWMGGAALEARAIGLFERLGLGREISIQHLVERLIRLATNSPSQDVRDMMNLIVRHMLERSDSWTDHDRASIRRLAEHAWAPGALNGEALQQWSKPTELQRPFRTETFLSQAALIDLPVLRNHRSAQHFLELIGAPSEAPTTAVVGHLRFLAEGGKPPMESIYSVLSERIDRDRTTILDMAGENVIWHPGRELYLSPDRLFWNQPPFRVYWSKATTSHARNDALFRALGVEDDPSPASFARLLIQIAGANPSGLEDQPSEALIVALIWNALSAGLGDPGSNVREVLADISNDRIFLTQGQQFRYRNEVVWCDAPKLAEPFGDTVEGLLLAPPETNAALLYRLLDVPALSDVVVLTASLIDNPRENPTAQARLRERAELLAWLAPTAGTALRMAEVISRIKVFDVDALSQRAEFTGGPADIVSPSTTVKAFFDASTDTLYARPGPSEIPDWSTILHAILPALVRGEPFDLPRTILSGLVVLNASSIEEAELALRGSGLEPHGSWILHAAEDADDAEHDHWGHDDEPELTGWEDREPRAGSSAPAAEPHHPGDAAAGSRSALGSGGTTTGASEGPSSASPAPAANETPPSANDSRLKPTTARTQRLRSYVSGSHESGGSAGTGGGAYDNPIDEGAMQAALDFERAAGRTPERQGHTNPGFDIVSTDLATGVKRVIEVKGLAGDWNARGVKLSATQFATAERHGDDFWLYVVERAADARSRQLTTLNNPFGKVEEFWFDDLWREQAEKPIAAKDLAFTAGRRVRHRHFGDGVLESVLKRGLVTQTVVAFTDGTRKSLLVSKDLEALSE